MDHLGKLIAEAGDIIEKRAGKTAPKTQPASGSEDETVKLAQLLMSDNPAEKVAEVAGDAAVEKIAHAAAIIDTLLNLDQFEKLAEFEKQAKEKGFTDEQISQVLEKRADKWKSIAQYVTLPAVAASGLVGHHMGKKKGYDKAMDDVSKAFSAYPGPANE